MTGMAARKGAFPSDLVPAGAPSAPCLQVQAVLPERTPELSLGQSTTFPSHASALMPGLGPAPHTVSEMCLQFLLLIPKKCSETVISLKSLSCHFNDLSFHWNFLALDPSEGTGK